MENINPKYALDGQGKSQKKKGTILVIAFQIYTT